MHSLYRIVWSTKGEEGMIINSDSYEGLYAVENVTGLPLATLNAVEIAPRETSSRNLTSNNLLVAITMLYADNI